MDEMHKLGMYRWDVRHWPTPTQVTFVKSDTKKNVAALDMRDPVGGPSRTMSPQKKVFPSETPTRKALEPLGAEFARLQKKKSEKKANLLSGHMFTYLVSRML